MNSILQPPGGIHSPCLSSDFATRMFLERNWAFWLKYENNSFPQHLNTNNHAFPDDSGIKLIRAERNPFNVSVYESLEFVKLFNKNSN